MSTVAIPECLDRLVEFLNRQSSRVPIESLHRHLQGLDVCVEDLRAFMQFGDSCYRRNLICQGKWFELLCICWRNGQKSVIHNHAGSTCGLRIVEGKATETSFDLCADGRVKPRTSRDFVPGQVCCTQDEDIHQVVNTCPDGGNLVTLHIYSPPLADMQTWECAEPAN